MNAAAPKVVKGGDGICRVCSAPFIHSEKDTPATCGHIVCHSLHHWSDQEWEGRASIAASKRRVGIRLQRLDVEALRRHPDPRSSFEEEVPW